jgi:acetyl esterase
MTERTRHVPGQAHNPPPLEPTTQEFVDGLAAQNSQIGELPIAEARAALVAMQARPTGKPITSTEDIMAPIGPKGFVHLRLVRPTELKEPPPVVMLFHGGGWALGDATTHDRLARELAVGVRATVAVVEFSRTPESRFPTAIEEAYAATKYIAENSASFAVDGSRIAVVGDGSGGNIAAAVTLLCKERGGPKISFQVLFYPVTGANFDTPSYRTFESGPWLTKQAMEHFWAAYIPNKVDREVVTATPVNASVDQLRGLPDALIITAESDVLRDEGEAYARKLCEANVRVTCSRYLGTIHDFVMLNAIADTPAARGAIAQATNALRDALVVGATCGSSFPPHMASYRNTEISHGTHRDV